MSSAILVKRLRELAFLNAGIKISLEDERTEKKWDFHYEGGVREFVEYLNQNKTVLGTRAVYFKSEKNMFQTVPIIKASTLKDCFYTFFAKPNGEVVELIYFEG